MVGIPKTYEVEFGFQQIKTMPTQTSAYGITIKNKNFSMSQKLVLSSN
jgi:hypothetical protein